MTDEYKQKNVVFGTCGCGNKKAYLNLAINYQIIVNKPNLQGFVRELVYDVLKNKLTINYLY